MPVDEDGDVLPEIPSPPYILTFPRSRYEALKDRDVNGGNFVSPRVGKLVGSTEKLASSNDDSILVQTYKSKAIGPYAVKETRKNIVPFTPTQGLLTLFLILK